MTFEEIQKIMKCMSNMEFHCCFGCAESLMIYFCNEFPEYNKTARIEFYKLFPDKEEAIIKLKFMINVLKEIEEDLIEDKNV